jgi:hypothetical protein
VSLSNYLELKWLDHTLKNTGYTSPATVYMAAYTSDPGEANTGTEVSGGSYARVAVTFGAASGGQSLNSADIVFTTATGSWGTITHFAIFDALTSGNMLVYGALGAPIGISTGQRLRFDAGTVAVNLD